MPPRDEIEELRAEIISCRRCPRLVEHRERMAREKRRAFRDWEYWGKPVPGFGDPRARLLILGLAPAAHGANRTGRMFTGDRSGDWLYRALHKAGFASQPSSSRADDGLTLRDAYITAAARCAPPDNRPLRVEIEGCRSYLLRELGLLPRVRAILALGKIGFDAALRLLVERGAVIPRPSPRFAHGAVASLGDEHPIVVASYHPSQQNTQTGRLTEKMLDDVMRQVQKVLARKLGSGSNFREIRT
jgi:uracil-DNA glycosylase family 4